MKCVETGYELKQILHSPNFAVNRSEKQAKLAKMAQQHFLWKYLTLQYIFIILQYV